MTENLLPPAAKQIPVTRTHHGKSFVDNYEWMRDKESPEVIAHLEAENAYTEARTAHLADLREAIFTEIKTRTKETDMSVPSRRGEYWYFARTFAGKDYPAQCRIPALPADHPDAWVPPVVTEEPAAGEETLLDLNAEAVGHKFFSLGAFDLSSDGTRLVWSADYAGDERYTIKVRDLTTGEDLADEITGAFAGATIDATGTYVFYTTVDDAWRPDTVWRHEIGTPTSTDAKIFHEPDERFFVGVGATRSEKYLMIVTSSKTTSGYWYLDAANPLAAPQPVLPREEGLDYSADHAVLDGRDYFVIVHNKDREDFDATLVAVDDPQLPGTPLITDPEGMRIEEVEAFLGFLAVSYRKGGFARVGTIDLGTANTAAEVPAAERESLAFELTEVAVDQALGTMETGSNPEFNQPTLRLTFGSLITPNTLFDLDVRTGERTVLKQQEVLGGVNLGELRQDLVWATAQDGTKIPVSLVWNETKVPEGFSAQGSPTPAPMLIYGYGSYEMSMDPSFGIARLSLLDRGVVYAIAHVRGGGEMGRHWYDQGKTLTKKNTFTDFIAATKHVHSLGLSSPERTVALGGSAGGLLMGAIANMAPELYAGISAHVPFVDALTSILMPELPLTVIEWEEWGDPLHDPEVYDYMAGYTPYENVGEHPYPKILAMTSLNDTRVLYVEPAKWVARLREVGADAMLKTEMVAGHGGASGRYDAWKERAFDYAWILDTLGLAG